MTGRMEKALSYIANASIELSIDKARYQAVEFQRVAKEALGGECGMPDVWREINGRIIDENKQLQDRILYLESQLYSKDSGCE